MQKTLVVYFSRSGRTREVAEAIAAGVGADIECVREAKGRLGMLGCIGTPVWASNVCSPVRAYLRQQQNRLGAVALFCTQGGSGAMKVLGRMAELCGHRPVATLIINDDQITRHRYADKLAGFLKAIASAQAA